MSRNFGFTFGRTAEGREKDYAELVKRLEQEKKPVTPVANAPDNTIQNPVSAQNPVLVNPRIDLKDYIQVGINGLHGNPVLISKFEMPNANNKNYEDTHKFVLSNGLYIPTPQIFMTHFCNVVKAYETRNNKKGISLILDGNNLTIAGKELEDIYKHLTKDHIAVYGNQKGAWTWLNGRFVKGNGFNGLDLETITGIDKKGKFTTNRIPLEQCVWDDNYVNLDFNSQGLAKTQSSTQSYEQGKNVYFWYPRENRVAWFDAYSGRAVLGCDRDADYSNPSLGVFTCAEGAVAKNTGGKK